MSWIPLRSSVRALAMLAAIVGIVVAGDRSWAASARQTGATQPAVPAASTQRSAAPITITARDYSFEGPDTVPAGPVAFTLRNEGQEAHHAQFVRLNDGVTLEQFGAALRQGPGAAFPLVTFRGGPAVTDPGRTSFEVTLDLEPGTYMMLCFIESPDGVPHLAKGMVRPFVVSSPPTVVMRDFAFDAPEIHAGGQTLRVVNQGRQPHEMAIARVPDDVTPEQIAAALQSPEAPPFPMENLSGMQALSAGLSGWVTVDFTPGTYVLLCFVPDAATGLPHVALGMYAVVTVR
jgi:plastocyanin